MTDEKKSHNGALKDAVVSPLKTAAEQERATEVFWKTYHDSLQQESRKIENGTPAQVFPGVLSGV